MSTLRQAISDGGQRDALIEDACVVLDAEVADKKGLAGIAVKTGYKVLKSFQPGFVRKAVAFLLDDFLDALDPIYQEALVDRVAPGAHLKANPARVADALLATTDERAQRARSELLRKTYYKLRPTAKQHVEASVPRLGDLMAKYAAA
ncbi:MAG: hypothetical protein MJD61_13350 [Proteobacteria bacterium]|nr:hypothetical protein [Pseudomonadota bacterium]